MSPLPIPKYNIGDSVYYAGVTITKKQHPCPDCLGKKTWHVRSPAGGVYEVACPRCSAGYRANRALDLSYPTVEPAVRSLTIGSVQLNTNSAEPIRYMCVETGIGSGLVYGEKDLFASREQAEDSAAAKCSADATPWVAERYAESVQFCDYELRPAIAASERAEVSLLERRLKDIMDDFRECESMEDVQYALAVWDAK